MKKLLLCLTALIPIVLATVLYSYIIRLPLFLDDGLLYAMIHDFGPDAVPGVRFWRGSPFFQYYRPLSFTVLEIDYGEDEALSALNLHFIHLMQFVITVSGITALARRITRNHFAGIIAGCAFALYPFSFRTVMWVSAGVFHLQAIMGIVLVLYFALRWLDKQAVFPLIGAYLCTFIALFSQETSVILPGLLLITIIFVYGFSYVWRWQVWTLLLPITALTGVFLYLFATVPRPAAGAFIVYWDMFPASLAVFSQGFSYPFAAIIRRLTLENAKTIPLLLLIAGDITLGLWLVGKQYRRVAIYGITLFVAMVIVPCLLIPTDYLKGTIHILIWGAVGTSIFRGATLAGVFMHPNAKKSKRENRDALYYTPAAQNSEKYVFVKRTAAIFIMGSSIVVSLAYLNARRTEALKQSAYVWELMAMVEQTPDNTALLNAPAFLSALEHHRWFLATSEATMFMEGSYTNYAQIFRAMTGRYFPPIQAYVYQQGFAAPPDFVYAPYWTGVPTDLMAELRQFDHIYLTIYEGNYFYPIYLGSGHQVVNENGLAVPETSGQ